MQRNREVWVIDASVAAKWHLRDEPLREEADFFWDRFQGGTITAIAPHLSMHEIASALSVASWAGRIGQDDAMAEIDRYASCGIAMADDPAWLVADASGIAVRLRVPYYDCVYVALAQRLGARLVTSDRKLFDAVSSRLPFIHWLGGVSLT